MNNTEHYESLGECRGMVLKPHVTIRQNKLLDWEAILDDGRFLPVTRVDILMPFDGKPTVRITYDGAPWPADGSKPDDPFADAIEAGHKVDRVMHLELGEVKFEGWLDNSNARLELFRKMFPVQVDIPPFRAGSPESDALEASLA